MSSNGDSLVCCEECGGSAGVNWYCPACGGALCDTCNSKLNLHVKKHSDVVRRIAGGEEGRPPQFGLEELKREQKALEKQITEAAELNSTVHKCISDRFATLRTLLDAKEKEFTNKASRLVAEQTYVLGHIQEIIERREQETTATSAPSPLSEEEEQLIAELRGGTGIFARGERLALDLRCAAAAGLREAARISAFIGTLDASHVTYPIITRIDTGKARTCHSVAVEWATDMPDMGLMTYQLEYRRAGPGVADTFRLAYEGKAAHAVVEDLSESSEYAFRVRISYDGQLWSKWTAEARCTTLALPCPAGIAATHSPTAVALTWAAVRAHTTRSCVYQVAYRDEDFNETKYKDNPATVEGDGVTSWAVGGLTPQKLYMFTVRAGFDGKWSEWSPEVEVVTQIPRPSDLTPLNITPVSLTVSWRLDNPVCVCCDAKEGKAAENEASAAENGEICEEKKEAETGNAKKNKKREPTATPRQQQQQQQNRGNGNTSKKKGKRVPVPSTSPSTSPSPVPSPGTSTTTTSSSSSGAPQKKGSGKHKKEEEEEENSAESHMFQAELRRLQDNEVVSTYTGSSAEVTFEGLTPETKYSLRVRAEWDGVWGKWCNALEVETEWSKYFKWAQCPLAVKRKRAYTLEGKRGRVATACTAASGDEHCTVLGAAPFLANCVADWEIRVLKSKDDNGNLVYVGVAPAEMSQGDEKSISHGWFFSCYKSALFSGKPNNFWCKEYGPRKANGEYVKTGDSVCASMDTALGKLSFALKRDGVKTDLGVAFEGIPLDKPLVPAVIMYNCGDSVEFV